MPATPPALLRVRALTKRYGVARAVDGVDFEVGAGEIVGLLGPNGAGKTTVLECLLGLRPPDAGEVLIDGVDVRVRPTEARRRVGAQIQPSALQDKITPREALAFFGSFHRTPAPAGDLLARFGLDEKADARFDTLSTGQRQRLALALAFVNRPALLVLDEPTTGLDPQTRRALHTILAEHRAAGGAALVSTHDLDEAQRLCDRVAILHRGRLVALDRPAALIARAGAATRILVRTSRALPPASTAALPCWRNLTPDTGEIHTPEPTTLLATLTEAVRAADDEIVELRLTPPTLEDAFVALTGEAWDRGTEEPR